jgi:hypothetical protein
MNRVPLSKKHYSDPKEIIQILLSEHDKNVINSSTPIFPETSGSYLVDKSCLANKRDILVDDAGVWKQNGTRTKSIKYNDGKLWYK